VPIPDITHRNVESSNLKSVGYDPTTRTLEIQFLSGSVYQYSGVPAGVYEALLAAPSKGQYFHRAIRLTYPFKKVAIRSGHG